MTSPPATFDRIQTSKAPAAIGPYSQAIACDRIVFCSGQIALDPATGVLVGNGDIEKETEQVLDNLGAVLEAAGASFATVVQATIYLTNLEEFATVNRLYGARVSERTPPARATVQVAALPKGARVEVAAIAFRPS